MLEQVQLSQEAIHILSLSPGSRTEEQLQTVSRLIDELQLDRIYSEYLFKYYTKHVRPCLTIDQNTDRRAENSTQMRSNTWVLNNIFLKLRKIRRNKVVQILFV